MTEPVRKLAAFDGACAVCHEKTHVGFWIWFFRGPDGKGLTWHDHHGRDGYPWQQAPWQGGPPAVAPTMPQEGPQPPAGAAISDLAGAIIDQLKEITEQLREMNVHLSAIEARWKL